MSQKVVAIIVANDCVEKVDTHGVFKLCNQFLSHAVFIACFLMLVLFNNYSGAAQEKFANNIPSSFRGAELYAEVLNKGKVKVYLKKYYDCGNAPLDETDTVSLQESPTLRILEPIILKKQTIGTQDNKHLQTPENSKTGCVIVITFSGEVDLGERHMDYTITWGYCCFDHTVKNLASEKPQGIALSFDLINDGTMLKNTMPSLTELPAFVIKQNRDGAYNIHYVDAEHDKVSIALSTPYSLISTRFNPGDNSPVNSGLLPVGKSVITGRSPFLKVQYAKGYSESNPLNAKLLSVDENTGMLRYKQLQTGKYLAAVTIKDMRENKTLSEHQCVFLIDVMP